MIAINLNDKSISNNNNKHFLSLWLCISLKINQNKPRLSVKLEMINVYIRVVRKLELITL